MTTVVTPEQIRSNLDEVRQRIAEACREAGRKPEEVKLLAVSKTFPAASVLAACAHEQLDFGENYVQEARFKVDALPKCHWHLIGPLQKNKMNLALDLFKTIHSLESVEQIQGLDKRARARRVVPRILLQVRLGDEESKHGFDPETLLSELDKLNEAPPTVLKISGLMTVPPWGQDGEANRPHFRRLRELCDQVVARGYPFWDGRELSMGMTDDFPAAIQEGATWVRVGRAIFGSR